MQPYILRRNKAWSAPIESGKQDQSLSTISSSPKLTGWHSRYGLRLLVTDINGLTASDSHRVRIDGAAKVGLVQLSFVGMAIEMAGLPLTVVCSYDSRIKRSGGFKEIGGGLVDRSIRCHVRLQHERSKWSLETTSRLCTHCFVGSLRKPFIEQDSGCGKTFGL